MGLEGELELIKIVKQFDLRYEHRLEQRSITDYFYDMPPEAISECNHYLRKNRMLPRAKRTKQIDLLVWKEGHWAALAIEEKNQNWNRKSLDIYKDSVVLRTSYGYGSKQFADSGRDLSLQCLGESYLGKAFFTANSLDYEVLPVAVVDYDLTVNSMIETGWVFNRGIVYVNKKHFPWFLGEYDSNEKWIRKLREKNPKMFYA